MGGMKRVMAAALGWTAFGLGWLGIFIPGLPTTIFWIVAAAAFLRADRRMYARIVANRRFGPGVRMFVERGMISARGKVISIAAMSGFACMGALAMPKAWLKAAVLLAAVAGSVWVACLRTPEAEARRLAASRRDASDSASA